MEQDLDQELDPVLTDDAVPQMDPTDPTEPLPQQTDNGPRPEDGLQDDVDQTPAADLDDE